MCSVSSDLRPFLPRTTDHSPPRQRLLTRVCQGEWVWRPHNGGPQQKDTTAVHRQTQPHTLNENCPTKVIQCVRAGVGEDSRFRAALTISAAFFSAARSLSIWIEVEKGTEAEAEDEITVVPQKQSHDTNIIRSICRRQVSKKCRVQRRCG
jgi:hypothetical protein